MVQIFSCPSLLSASIVDASKGTFDFFLLKNHHAAPPTAASPRIAAAMTAAITYFK